MWSPTTSRRFITSSPKPVAHPALMWVMDWNRPFSYRLSRASSLLSSLSEHAMKVAVFLAAIPFELRSFEPALP